MQHVRYALVLAGGSGTRLWPLSRRDRPKQLLPLIQGRSLLELAFQRLEGLVDPDKRLICAAEEHRRPIRRQVAVARENYLGEPVGRDTLAALAYSAAAIAERNARAIIGVFTSDHLIEPRSTFLQAVSSGYDFVELHPETLVTFGITPTAPATGFGYLELGEPLAGPARRVCRFQEKPDVETALRYLQAGPERYLWNSGMFIWNARTFLDCVQRYQPQTAAGIQRILRTRGRLRRRAALRAVYPGLKKISVDFAVMEPASLDPQVQVAAIPMPLALRWRDIGSWPTYAEACSADAQGNAVVGPRSVLLDCGGNVVVSSDPGHLVAAVGCADLVVVHTPDATLICPKERAQQIKDVLARLHESYGSEYD
jgi:mannose-1-phosphate guanylyltransferase